MPITFYYGSGSAPAWRVWLALEHKRLPYDFRLMSFSDGHLKKLEFLALNPRGRVPTITDGEFVLYESSAIVEYLDEQYPATPRLFPGASRERALVRRRVSEIDDDVDGAFATLTRAVLGTARADWKEDAIAAARAAWLAELETIADGMAGDYLCGDRVTAADFALYPMLAVAARCDLKKPELRVAAARPARIGAWAARIEALPYFATTTPPHWKA